MLNQSKKDAIFQSLSIHQGLFFSHCCDTEQHADFSLQWSLRDYLHVPTYSLGYALIIQSQQEILEPSSICILVRNPLERSQVHNIIRFSERKVMQFLRTCLFLVFFSIPYQTGFVAYSSQSQAYCMCFAGVNYRKQKLQYF